MKAFNGRPHSHCKFDRTSVKLQSCLYSITADPACVMCYPLPLSDQFSNHVEQIVFYGSRRRSLGIADRHEFDRPTRVGPPVDVPGADSGSGRSGARAGQRKPCTRDLGGGFAFARMRTRRRHSLATPSAARTISQPSNCKVLIYAHLPVKGGGPSSQLCGPDGNTWIAAPGECATSCDIRRRRHWHNQNSKACSSRTLADGTVGGKANSGANITASKQLVLGEARSLAMAACLSEPDARLNSGRGHQPSGRFWGTPSP